MEYILIYTDNYNELCYAFFKDKKEVIIYLEKEPNIVIEYAGATKEIKIKAKEVAIKFEIED